mmetsp:Transcript_8053/g.23883  ORF Transcript_8053/g.23883 Transcript_8053/m.23883 type:complete len:207 (+) Transcript_8053:4044-4664(+)
MRCSRSAASTGSTTWAGPSCKDRGGGASTASCSAPPTTTPSVSSSKTASSTGFTPSKTASSTTTPSAEAPFETEAPPAADCIASIFLADSFPAWGTWAAGSGVLSDVETSVSVAVAAAEATEGTRESECADTKACPAGELAVCCSDIVVSCTGAAVASMKSGCLNTDSGERGCFANLGCCIVATVAAFRLSSPHGSAASPFGLQTP